MDAYYSDVPDAQREGLRAFREAHPPQTVTINGTAWTYHRAGDRGKPTILWLVGGIKVADIAYDTIPLLQDDYFILTPNYPALDSMDDLAAGLVGVLDAEGIERVHLLAGSFGGMLAQAFVRHAPERVEAVVLSTTTPPNPQLAKKYGQQLMMARLVPEGILRGESKKRMFTTIAPPDEKAAFYRAYLDELFTERLGKRDIISLYDAMIGYLKADYAPDDLTGWTGRMLILASDNDATFDDTARAGLLDLYPQAETYVFTGAGHSPSSTQRTLFFDIVRRFFAGQAIADEGV